jgi:hypothetical protein
VEQIGGDVASLLGLRVRVSQRAFHRRNGRAGIGRRL